MIIVLTYALLWCCMLAYSAYLRIGKERVGQIATGTLVASWALLTFGLVSRALEEGHWPLANRYEFALCTLWTITSITMLLEKSWRKRHAGTFILAITLLIATYAVTSPESEKVIMPLLPALRTIWLQVHVISAAIAYGAFGVAAGLGFMRLVWKNSAVNKTWEGQSVSQEEIERMMERIVSLGFPWLTLGILSGAIWAQNAWGRYWGWDPKETWALVTWLWYLLVLHIRSVRNWRGWRLAGLTTAGFGVVLFTFIGVPWLVRSIRLESLHGF